MILIGIRQASINKLARGKRFLLAIPFLMRLLNYVLCRRDERISVRSRREIVVESVIRRASREEEIGREAPSQVG